MSRNVHSLVAQNLVAPAIGSTSSLDISLEATSVDDSKLQIVSTNTTGDAVIDVSADNVIALSTELRVDTHEVTIESAARSILINISKTFRIQT